ncbi:T9SS type B sorting domain-containing protein, partial [Lutibacter sp.]|uniref:T9SS type B sorting domain-containing protein n=1 Tax=Lutibacter sp. TaxID=1925666 RepID=UPI00356A6137
LGIGDYEYALAKLDGFVSSFQDEPYFDHLAAGIYTVFIQDKNNCGIAQLETSVVGFPKFFTPNNDGFNDTWNIVGINDKFYTSSMVNIFDRFGKLVAQINPNENGWDGLFKGNPLPATDYWFSVELVDTIGNIRTRKGHFSLIRR